MNAEPSDRADRLRSKRMKKAGFERTTALGVSPRNALIYKLADTPAELEAAFALVYQSYVDAGLQVPVASGVRFTKYHLLPTTRVFVALRQAGHDVRSPNGRHPELRPNVLGTVSLIEDSAMGLPIDEVAGPSVEKLRRAKAKIAEVSALAVKHDVRGINVTMGLFRLLGHYCAQAGVTHLGATVTPRHVSFYRDTLLFEPCGEPMEYASANGNAVQGNMLDFAHWGENLERAYGQLDFDSNLAAFFQVGREVPVNVPEQMNPALVARLLAARADIDAGLSAADRQLLQYVYRRGPSH